MGPFEDHNAGVQSAIREYREHPTAACRGTDPRGRDVIPCDQLALDNDTHCTRHRQRLDRLAAEERARKKARA